MRFFVKNNTTDEVREMNESEVRQEIIDTFEHDMETYQEYSDDEIADNGNGLDLEHFFNMQPHGIFEGRTYDIQRL
jgi:hypothetical protein